MKSEVAGQKGNETVTDQAIIERVSDFKIKHPDLKSITLSANDTVTYDRVVKLVGGLKETPKENQVPVIFSGNPE